MKTTYLPLIALLCCAIFPVDHVLADDQQHSRPIGTSVHNGWVTVVPPEFHGAKPEETFGRTPDETMTVPAYRRHMIDKIRRYHVSYLGWIDNFDAAEREVLAGAAEVQEAFGYRFVLDSARYPLAIPPVA